jgi:gamma-D-glutamyl-L-lysine dipeptidyl-peptidase
VKNNFYNKSLGNIYSKPFVNSEITSQILYGEKFTILSKSKNWVKIKTNFDKYTGFIKNDSFTKSIKATHKVYILRGKIFKNIKSRFVATKKYLYFSSTIKNLEVKKNFIRFEKNNWIKKNHLRKINHIEKNYIKIFKSFLKTKYLWGGKSVDGIDCSALIQIFFRYNNKFFPRDTKDQMKFCKKKINKGFKSGDIIFWKGHVGLCINSKKFIHAYGPKKKVLVMPINLTINLIANTANLKVKKIINIKDC